MTEKRVIFQLTNGKRKYATDGKEILLFDENDLNALYQNFSKYERFVFTEDYSDFGFTIEELKERHPFAKKFNRVKGIVTEDPNKPLNPKIIL